MGFLVILVLLFGVQGMRDIIGGLASTILSVALIIGIILFFIWLLSKANEPKEKTKSEEKKPVAKSRYDWIFTILAVAAFYGVCCFASTHNWVFLAPAGIILLLCILPTGRKKSS